MSIWDDVAMDPASAAEAARELRAQAAELEALAQRRAELADGAAREWTGELRELFVRDLTILQDATAMLVADLEAAADTIEDDLAEARHEQSRRQDARDEWRRERRAESIPRGVR